MSEHDHYLQARDKELDAVRENYNPRRLKNLGVEITGEDLIQLPCLKWTLHFRLDPFEAVVLPDAEPLDVIWQVLALDYLNASIPPPTREFLSFTDFSELRTYREAFEGRVTGRLTHTAGETAEGLEKAARECGGKRQGKNPPLWVFDFFPLFPLQVVRHPGDEELPPTCKELFPDNAVQLLTTESVIVAAEKLVASLGGRGPAS